MDCWDPNEPPPTFRERLAMFDVEDLAILLGMVGLAVVGFVELLGLLP